MDGYQLAERVRDALKTAAGRAQCWTLSSSRPNDSTVPRWNASGPIDLGNGRLRALAADTVGRGWWQLLWVPPSMPYLTPAGPYAECVRAEHDQAAHLLVLVGRADSDRVTAQLRGRTPTLSRTVG